MKPSREQPAKTKSVSTAAILDLPRWLLALFLILAVVAAYQPLWHAGFIWDDDVYVTNNPLLTASDGLKQIWFSTNSPSQYFPLTYTTFRIERSIWGLNASGYHWVNILLHAINSLLVWKLLKRLTIPGAWLAAAIFALHPVQVESVAWITEQKNALMCFFFLLTLLSWIEFFEARDERWRWYWLALFLYSLALFSKTTACTLPAAMLLILWLKRHPINWQHILQIAPFMAMGIGMGLLTMWWERHHIGTQGKMFAMTWPERLIVATHAIWFYIGKFFWPINLVFSYPKWEIDAHAITSYGWLLSLTLLGIAIYFLRRHIGRSVEMAMLFFVATLSPILGFIMLYTFHYTFVADHYQYVACIGLIALFAAGIFTIFKNKSILRFFISGILLPTLAVLTFHQCQMYRDEETLWRATIQKNPASWMAYDNLSRILLGKGQLDETIQCEQKALELNPHDEVACDNLGIAYFQKGRTQDALAIYKTAVEINPYFIEGYNGFGNALLQNGQVADAIAIYRKALALNPNSAETLNNLGRVLIDNGRPKEALGYLQRAVQLRPNVAMIQYNFGRALLANGQLESAVAHYKIAVTFQFVPNAGQDFFAADRLQKTSGIPDACQQLAWILATSPIALVRDGNKAVELAQLTGKMVGEENPYVLGTLGAAYAETGQFSKAIESAQHALQLANNQKNKQMAALFESQIKLYQSGLPYRDASLTNAPAQ